jgi:pre-mRNA-splicing factor ATP-dependent RNA helicase DHX15/PRP43
MLLFHCVAHCTSPSFKRGILVAFAVFIAAKKGGNNPTEYTKPLPALALRSDLEAKVMESNVVIVQGATGSGKSTQIPQYLASMLPRTRKPKPVVCTQPRKIAALGLADRVAYEYSGGSTAYKVGKSGQVGYHVGGRKETGQYCEVIYMTEVNQLLQVLRASSNMRCSCMQGVLLNQLLSATPGKPVIDKYSAIVIDEAHERSIDTDLLLGLLKTAVVKSKTTPKIVVTSATMELEKFQQYFETSGIDAPAMKIPGLSSCHRRQA